MINSIRIIQNSQKLLLSNCLYTLINYRHVHQIIEDASVRQGLVGMVGRTPLVRLNRVSEETGCEILAKAEFCNGGGSVKDRAALYLIRDAENKNLLKKGGTVVEGTAGNTGIGLAHLCLAMGYKCVIFMPDNQSQEKVEVLRSLGATVKQVPVVVYTDPDNYNHQARRYAENTENAVWMNQFDNKANRQAHIEMTGPEIWQQTGGKVDAVAMSTGTGGTLSGTSIYLKEKKPSVQSFLADPQGSVLDSWFNKSELTRSDGSSISEGIGQGRVTDNLNGAPIDHAMCVLDTDAMCMTYRLLHEEGLFVGVSTGINVYAAVQAAKLLGPGHTIVTILCDTGQRYYKKICSREFLTNQGLLECIPEPYRKSLF